MVVVVVGLFVWVVCFVAGLMGVWGVDRGGMCECVWDRWGCGCCSVV